MKHCIPSFIAILFICSASAGAAEKTPSKPTPLTFSLSSTLAPAPAQVTARVKVEPDPRSRSLTIEWWSDEGAGGSHTLTLDGANAAARQDFAIKHIEPGVYVVRAIVARNDGTFVRKESNLIVVGQGTRFKANPDGGTDLMLDPAMPRR